MKAIILLGAPGAGKGTLAVALKDKIGCTHVSTGDMLRASIRAGTPVGVEAKAFIDKGALVPDGVILRLVEDLLLQGTQDAYYMFDGFPRTMEQARMLDELFQRLGGRIQRVFLLEASKQEILRRITGRRICKACGAIFHVANMPPRVEGVCDSCGGELYQRADDSEHTVLNRLDVYEQQTASLIEYYRLANLLTVIPMGDVASEVAVAVKVLGNPS